MAINENTGLADCPCGGTADIAIRADGPWIIRCLSCKAELRFWGFRRYAIDAWNDAALDPTDPEARMWEAIGEALDAAAGVVRDGVWFTEREAIIAMAAVAEAIDGWEERGGMDHEQTVTARLVMRKVAAFVSAEHRRAALATEDPTPTEPTE